MGIDGADESTTARTGAGGPLKTRKNTNANITVTDEMISPAILAQIGTSELALA